MDILNDIENKVKCNLINSINNVKSSKMLTAITLGVKNASWSLIKTLTAINNASVKQSVL